MVIAMISAAHYYIAMWLYRYIVKLHLVFIRKFSYNVKTSLQKKCANSVQSITVLSVAAHTAVCHKAVLTGAGQAVLSL